MTQTTPTRKYRYIQLAAQLRTEIKQGVYPLGTKLPSERMLAEKYGVTHITVRQSLDILVREGLVVRSPGSGTFVNATWEMPIVGILFGPKLTNESAHFYRALLGAFETCISAMSYRCRSYDGFNYTPYEVGVQHPPYQALLSDAQHHPFKAYVKISVDDPGWSQEPPLRGLPKVSFGLLQADVTHDYYRFAQECMQYALSRGWQKMIYIRCFSSVSNDLKGFKDFSRRMNVAMPECIQIQGGGPNGYTDAQTHQKMRELTARWKKTNQWPDVIICSDDIATRGVALGLIEAGPEAVAKVAVITQANEGIYHYYGIPTINYVLSQQEIAEKVCELLQKRIESTEDVNPPQIQISGQFMNLFPSVSESMISNGAGAFAVIG